MTFVVFGQIGANRRMSTYKIANDEWQKLYAFLQSHPRAYAEQEEKCRRFVEAVHWILRTGGDGLVRQPKERARLAARADERDDGKLVRRQAQGMMKLHRKL